MITSEPKIKQELDRKLDKLFNLVSSHPEKLDEVVKENEDLIKKNYSQNLLFLRSYLGFLQHGEPFTRAEFSELIKVGSATLQQWEAGDYLPKKLYYKEILRITNLLLQTKDNMRIEHLYFKNLVLHLPELMFMGMQNRTYQKLPFSKRSELLEHIQKNVGALVDFFEEKDKKTAMETETLLNSIMNQFPDTIAIISHDGIIQHAWLGKNYKTLTNISGITDFIGLDLLDTLSTKFNLTDLSLQIMMKMKFNTIEPIEVNQILNDKLINIRFMKINKLGYLLIARDITDSSIYKKYFETLFEAVHDGVFITQDEEFVFINKSLAKILNSSVEDLINQPFAPFIAPEYREKVVDNHNKRIAGEKVPPEYEIEIISSNGKRKYIHLSMGLIDFENRPAVLATVKDITSQKQETQQLENTLGKLISLLIPEDEEKKKKLLEKLLSNEKK